MSTGRLGALATGAAWNLPPADRDAVVERVCAALVAVYGLPRHGNPERPIEDLAYVLISNRTPPERAARVYDALRAAYPEWESLPTAAPDDVAAVLQPAGLSRKKGRQLQQAVATILRDYGSLDAPGLWTKPDTELLAYLTALEGVSDKVARCVMLYTLGREVLPVDVHTHRVAFRLEWTARPWHAPRNLIQLIR